MKRSKQTQIQAEGRDAQGRGPWWRRRLVVIAASVVGGVVVVLGVAAALAWSKRPCWSTYRAPQLARDTCFADQDAAAFAPADAPEALKILTRGWEQGDRRAFVPVDAARAAAIVGDTARACEWLERALEVGVPDRRVFDDPAFAKMTDATCFTSFRVAHARLVAEREEGLTRQTPEEAGLNPVALTRLVARAKGTRTSALIILRNGAIVHEWYAEGGDTRTELMSATKAIAGLSIGLLVDEQRIPSADAPLSVYFPEWRQGDKSQVTLRHVLSHSSGLSARRDVMDFIWRDDFVRHAVEADLETEPGRVVFYNNKATNLIPGVVQKASGQPMDAFLDQRLFAPLGIRDFDWLRDPAGNPHGMSGLRMHPMELARIGVMLAQGGRWGERQILSEAWVKQALSQAAPASRTWGFLFQIHPRINHRTLDAAGLERLRRAGLSNATLKPLRSLLNRPLEASDFADEILRVGGLELYARLRDQDLLPPLQTSADDVGASAIGSGGIHLTVFPAEGLVAVRTTQTDGSGELAYEFPDFVNRVRALLPSLSVEQVAEAGR